MQGTKTRRHRTCDAALCSCPVHGAYDEPGCNLEPEASDPRRIAFLPGRTVLQRCVDEAANHGACNKGTGVGRRLAEGNCRQRRSPKDERPTLTQRRNSGRCRKRSNGALCCYELGILRHDDDDWQAPNYK